MTAEYGENYNYYYEYSEEVQTGTEGCPFDCHAVYTLEYFCCDLDVETYYNDPSDNGSSLLTVNSPSGQGEGVPGPIAGAGLPGLAFLGGGIVAWRRRRRARSVIPPGIGFLAWWRRKQTASENLAAA